MTSDDMRRYLSHLAVGRNVAAATQNQGLNAILFMYRHVLDIDTGEAIDAVRAEKGCRAIAKLVTVHTLRHSFATHLRESGTGIRTIQALFGHADLRTTMIYIHVASKNPLGVRSPLDRS